MISWEFKMNYKNNVALHNLTFSFALHSKPFFKDLTIDFKTGQINFICGKNGMGKSTLLKILSGNVAASQVQGVLHIDGEDFDVRQLDCMSRSIALVCQNFNNMLVDAYSFYENLQFALMSSFPSFGRLPVALPLPAFIEKYGINQHVPIHLLSGGQRQILSILMMLQRCPQILLLDEPTAALDEENAAIVMDFLQDLCVQENITIIAIVHDFDLVQKYGQGHYFELYQQDGIRNVRSIAI